MEHYRCNKAHTRKKITEQISDTVEFYPQQFNMPKMSSADATIHDAHDLICSINNPAPSIPIVKLGNTNKEELIPLAEMNTAGT